MHANNRPPLHVAALLIILSALVSGGFAQKSKKNRSKVEPVSHGRAVMWEPVDIASQDLFWGPGGKAMQPDLTSVKFIKEEKGGHNKKYRISDGSGRVWVAKLGTEARPETAAVRLLWGLGYKTEINYLVPSLTIPGKGTFRNVRLEARPDNIDRLEEWKWKKNPFVGTKELQGLKIMMVFMTNYDVLDLQNKVLQVGDERWYIVSDLGATFGKLGNNNLPLFFRLGRATGRPDKFIKTQLVRKVKNGELILSYKGKSRSVFKGITTADGRWLAEKLNRLSDGQVGDAFRAANYSPDEVALYVRAVRNKIIELDRAAGRDRIAYQPR
jgi:hypothetical protein